MDHQIYNFTWHDGVQNIEIEVLYSPLESGIISHFEIRSTSPEKAPLPITETGYLSHYFYPGSVDFTDIGVEQFIRNWLDQEAAKLQWKNWIESERQFTLF
nr:hypothetical protein [uncultured Cohaesibacter sp.]